MSSTLSLKGARVCICIYAGLKKGCKNIFELTAWGEARFRIARTSKTGRRVPVQRLGQGLTADLRLSNIRLASCSNVGITAQSVTPPKSNSHRNPQSLARGSGSTSRGTALPNHAIGVYGRTGLTDMASCCRCAASTRGLAVIDNRHLRSEAF